MSASSAQPSLDRNSALSYIEEMLGGLAEIAEAQGELKLAANLWMAAVETAQTRQHGQRLVKAR